MNNPLRKRSLRHRKGFTLLEVMGAVAILGISYIMLATISIQGMRAIGLSQRRIDASLIADQTLTELELGTETGQLLEPRVETWESGEFEVNLEIVDLSEQHKGLVGANGAGDLLEFLGQEANGPFAPFRQSNLLLGYLREIHVSVGWFEGADEKAVSRTAYLYDQQAWVENEQSDAEAEQTELQTQQTLGNGGLQDILQEQLQNQRGGER